MTPITRAALKIGLASFCNSWLQFRIGVRGIADTIRRLAERIERRENLSRTLDRNYFEECNLAQLSEETTIQCARRKMHPGFYINRIVYKDARIIRRLQDFAFFLTVRIFSSIAFRLLIFFLNIIYTRS